MNEVVIFVMGFIAGSALVQFSMRGIVKKRVETELLSCWTESRIVAVRKVVEALEEGISRNRWPSLAHFRRDLLKTQDDLEKHYKEGNISTIEM